MRPPMMVDSLVRWQASTVPARVLTTVDSTLPRSTAFNTTVTGLVRVLQNQAPAARASTTSAGSTRRRRMDVFMAGDYAAFAFVMIRPSPDPTDTRP